MSAANDARTAFITGATSGFGRAAAKRFVEAGWQVIGSGRRAERLDALRAELGDAFHPLAFDIRDEAALRAAIDTLPGRFRGIDLLVNNAGAFRPGGIAGEDDGALLDMLQANLFGAYRLTKRLLPKMVERRSGMVLNVCSTASIAAYPNGGSYSIAKHALHGFSRNLREEMKPHGVRVVALLPGATWTSSWDGVPLPEERLMPAGDVAQMAWTAWNMSARTVVEDIVMRPQRGDIGEADFEQASLGDLPA